MPFFSFTQNWLERWLAASCAVEPYMFADETVARACARRVGSIRAFSWAFAISAIAILVSLATSQTDPLSFEHEDNTASSSKERLRRLRTESARRLLLVTATRALAVMFFFFFVLRWVFQTTIQSEYRAAASAVNSLKMQGLAHETALEHVRATSAARMNAEALKDIASAVRQAATLNLVPKIV